jgi:hypothetical protein
MISKLACLLFALLLSACAAPRQAMNPDAPPPRGLELQEERRIATMHFHPGLYSLDSSDRTGYYYRAPEGVIEHGFAGSQRREGGIFLARTTSKLRGYVVWAGERRKIGSVPRVEFVP